MYFQENEELPLTPGFMKSSIRPDRADKIRKMFSARKSIPIVPSPKKNSRQEILKMINRKPDSIVQRQHDAQVIFGNCEFYDENFIFILGRSIRSSKTQF